MTERVLQHKKARPQILATSTLIRLAHDQGIHEIPRTRRCGQSPSCCLTFALSGRRRRSALERGVRSLDLETNYHVAPCRFAPGIPGKNSTAPFSFPPLFPLSPSTRPPPLPTPPPP